MGDLVIMPRLAVGDSFEYIRARTRREQRVYFFILVGCSSDVFPNSKKSSYDFDNLSPTYLQGRMDHLKCACPDILTSLCGNPVILGESVTVLPLQTWPPVFEYEQTASFGVRWLRLRE